ncbi:hypothetical protein [Clostridium polynesiense]|uniref:hypothetical protein n=1 Tax=Clostridium polynesiense TaxID=1325933 RepID=UPI0005913C21|nr:hypothetical protein [Clostridium polynesiense]
MINLIYKNTLDQCTNCLIHSMKLTDTYNKTLKRKTYLFSLLLIMGALYSGFSFIQFYSNKSIIKPSLALASAVYIILAVIVFIYFPKIDEWINRRHLKKHLSKAEDKFNEEIEITADDKEIRMKRPNFSQVFLHNQIIDVSKVEDCICVSLEGNSVIIVPMNAFKSKKEKNDFIELMKRK